MAFRSKSSSTSSTGLITVSKPSGVVDGDRVIVGIIVASQGSGNRVAAQEGWAPVVPFPPATFGGALGYQMFLFTHLASVDPATYSFYAEWLNTDTWTADTTAKMASALAYDADTISLANAQQNNASGTGNTTATATNGAVTNPVTSYTLITWMIVNRANSGTLVFTPNAALTQRDHVVGWNIANNDFYVYDETLSNTSVPSRAHTIGDTTVNRTYALHTLRFTGGKASSGSFTNASGAGDAWAWTN